MTTIVGTFMHTTKINAPVATKFFRFYSAPNAGATIYGPSLSNYFIQKDQIENLNTTGNTMYAYSIIPISTTSNIIFKTDATNRVMVFEIQGSVRTVNTVSQSPVAASVYPGQSVTVTAVMLGGSLATGQGVYLRYAPNSDYSNSSVVSMNYVSPGTYSGTIPASVNLANTTQSYYVFSSGSSAPNGADADLATINIKNNSGSNYSYTVLPGWNTAANGNWGTASTWTANSVPPTSISMGVVNVNHNVTMDQNAVVGSMNIGSLKTLDQNTAITLTTWGGIINNGTFNVNGTATLQFNSGGYINVNAPTFASGSTLVYNTGGSYDRSIEWGQITPGSPGYPWHVKVQNSTTLNLGTATPPSLEIGGDLTLGTSTTKGIVDMNALNLPLKILGNLVIGNASSTGSELKLSTTIGGDLYLYGNFTRYGNSNYYTDNNRAIYFEGTGNSTVNTPSASSQVFSYARIDKSVGTETVTFSTPTSISQEISLIKGIVNTDATNILSITNTNTNSLIGGSILSFINGPLKRYTSTSTADKYVFPVGKTGAPNLYKEMSLTTVNNLASGSNFTGEYFPSLPPTSGSDFFASILLGIVNSEYWQLDRNAGTTTGLVTIPYADPSNWRNVNALATSPNYACNVAIVKRSANSGTGTWDFTSTAGNFSTFSTPPEYRAYTDAGDIISREVTSFGPFTNGFGFTFLLPVRLQEFTGILENNNARLDWEISSVQDLVGFELQHSTDNLVYSKLYQAQNTGVLKYSYTHPKLSAGIHYYRLAVKEKSGKIFYSQVVMLLKGRIATQIAPLKQTVIRNELNAIIISSSGQIAQIVVTDAIGRIMIRQQKQLQPGQNAWDFNTGPLAPGIYFMTLLTKEGQKQTLRFIKE